MSYQISKHRDDIVYIQVNNGMNLNLTLCNYGASVYAVNYDKDLLVLTAKDKENYLHCPQFYGKTLGVVAGRIPCEGKLNHKPYHLVETTPGTGYDLHGGRLNSISFKVWDYDVKECLSNIKVIFKYETKNLENGFLGAVKIKVTYVISKKENSFKICFDASTKDVALCSLSNHIYWNFNNSINLNNYYLKMNANRYGLMRDDLLIIGKDKVPEYLDFRKGKGLKESLDYIESNLKIGTIDNTFLFTKGGGNVLLTNEEYRLELNTDFPAMNIFVDNSLAKVDFLNQGELKMRRAIALEPQLFVYDIPSITLKKGEKQKFFIEYKISKN